MQLVPCAGCPMVNAVCTLCWLSYGKCSLYLVLAVLWWMQFVSCTGCPVVNVVCSLYCPVVAAVCALYCPWWMQLVLCTFVWRMQFVLYCDECSLYLVWPVMNGSCTWYSIAECSFYPVLWFFVIDWVQNTSRLTVRWWMQFVRCMHLVNVVSILYCFVMTAVCSLCCPVVDAAYKVQSQSPILRQSMWYSVTSDVKCFAVCGVKWIRLWNFPFRKCTN